MNLPDGFATRLHAALGLTGTEKPRVSYVSLANDVARVQRFWVSGVQDPKSQKATYAGMFFDLVEALGAEGQLFSVKETDPVAGLSVRIEKLDSDGAVGGEVIHQIVDRIRAFCPHLVVVSPSISPDIIPMIASEFPTVYYGHSLLWPAHFDRPKATLKERLVRWVRLRRNAKKLKGVAGLIAASEACMRQYRSIIGHPVHEVSVTRQILSPVHVTTKSQMRHLLYVGGIEDWGGVAALVASFKTLRAQCPELTLTLIGDGPRRAEFEAMANSYNGLSFASGFDAEVQQQQVAKADLLVVPEPADALIGTPTFLPEGLINGLPALVSSTTPLREAEQDLCVVYQAGDQRDLEETLRRLYLDDDAYGTISDRLPLDDASFRDASLSWGSGIAQIFGKIAGIQ